MIYSHALNNSSTFLPTYQINHQIPQEKYYQSNFYMILRALGVDVQVEVVTNNGRIDAVIESSSTIYLFEFKIDSSAEQALQQIIEKQYFQKYLSNGKHIMLVGAEFLLRGEISKIGFHNK